jgi:hypothetical protein
MLLPAFAILAALPAAAGAQDEYELANGLAERGWNDLAEELFGRIRDNTTLPADQRAEGDYGLARIQILAAERTDHTDEKTKLFNEAIKKVEGFLEKYPNHRRRGEALSDIGYLYQSKGKALIAAAKVDPTKMEEGEKAFAAAEKRFQDLIAQLKKDEKKLPEDPQKNPKGMLEYEQWEEKLMFAKYNYATALFSHAETYKDNQSKHADMKRLLELMNNFLNNDFMWQYERYLLAYDAFIYMGRAYQLLAETSDREKAEDYWRQCFNYIGKGQTLLTDAENRKNESVRDIAARSLLFEMKARLTYGDIKRGQTGLKQYSDAAKKGDDFFKLFPNARFDDTGKALRLEQARALCKAGQTDKGVNLLKELIKTNKDSWVENVAIDYLGEYAGNESVQLAVEAGDNLMDRGPAFYYRAVQKYRKAILAVKKPEDQKHVGHCWAMIGKCYFLLGRHYEAVAALSMMEKPPLSNHEKAAEAVMRKLTSLAKISQATNLPEDKKAFEDFRAYITKAFPNQASDQLIRQQAIDLDDKKQYDKAAAEWDKLARPGKDSFEEAVFSVGFSYYNAGSQLFDQARKATGAQREALATQGMDAWKKSLEAFRKHVDFVDKMQGKEPKITKRAVGSVHFATKILTHERLNKAEDALTISNELEKRFPNADPRYVMSIMSTRIDAKLKLGQVQEAEEDLRALKSKSEKEGGIGAEQVARALAVLANAFEEAAEKEKKAGKDELYDLYAVKAATFYYEYYNLNPGAVSKPEQMEAMAEKLYMAAEQRMKLGEAKLGKEGLEEVRKIYTKSRDLYNAYLLEKEKTLAPDVLSAIKNRITRCFLMTGQFEEAVKIYQEIVNKDPQMKNGSAWEALSDCYVEQSKTMTKGGARNELLKQADKTYSQLAAMLMASQTLNEHTWRLLFKHASVLFEIDPDACRKFYDSMDLRGYAPKWDINEQGAPAWGYAPRFEELRKQLDAILPPKRQ